MKPGRDDLLQVYRRLQTETKRQDKRRHREWLRGFWPEDPLLTSLAVRRQRAHSAAVRDRFEAAGLPKPHHIGIGAPRAESKTGKHKHGKLTRHSVKAPLRFLTLKMPLQSAVVLEVLADYGDSADVTVAVEKRNKMSLEVWRIERKAETWKRVRPPRSASGAAKKKPATPSP